MNSNTFKSDCSYYHRPELISGMLDFIEQNSDLIVEPFLQGKALAMLTTFGY